MWGSQNNMQLYNLDGKTSKSDYKPTQVNFVWDINEGYEYGGSWVEIELVCVLY